MCLNQQMKAWYTDEKQSTYKTKRGLKKSHLNSERQQ